MGMNHTAPFSTLAKNELVHNKPREPGLVIKVCDSSSTEDQILLEAKKKKNSGSNPVEGKRVRNEGLPSYESRSFS